MKPLLFALLLPALLLGQETAPKPEEKAGSSAPAASPTAQTATPSAEAAAPAAEATAPAGEPNVSYAITFGYRGIPSRTGPSCLVSISPTTARGSGPIASNCR